MGRRPERYRAPHPRDIAGYGAAPRASPGSVLANWQASPSIAALNTKAAGQQNPSGARCRKGASYPNGATAQSCMLTFIEANAYVTESMSLSRPGEHA